VAELLRIKERHGTTLNDVVLAVCAGGARRYLHRHGQPAIPLKTMVPVNVRGDGAASNLGNQVSTLFVDLPCDEPDPVRRLEDVHAEMSERKRTGEPQGARALTQAFGYAPHPLQHAVTHAASGTRAFNLVVSNVPGPRRRLYMLGCPMEEVYPVVPLADGHSVAIGFTTYCDDACFGVFADRRSLPNAELLALDIEESIDELVTSPVAVRNMLSNSFRY
jgi:diacylglycerol O-acyltransferase